MKRFFSLTLALAFASFTSLALADDATVDITIAKASDSTATVSTLSDGKSVATVPITFASDASFDSLKDSYTVSSDTESKLASKKLALAVTADGVVTFNPAPKSAKCKAACAKK